MKHIQLKSFDLFGSLFKARVLSEDPYYKSAFGGGLTIVVYAFCLFYFIYGMVQWADGYFLPKVTTTESLSTNINYEVEYELLSVRMKDVNGNTNTIDPFKSVNNIITPYLIVLENNKITSMNPIYANSEGVVSLPKIRLILDQVKPYKQEVILSFMRCESNCAPNDQIIAFFKQPQNMIDVRVNLMQYNVDKQQYEMVPRQVSLALTDDQTYYGQLVLKVMDSSINTGWLADSIETKQIVNNFELIGQSMNQNYLQNSIGKTVYSHFYMQLSTTQVQQTIAFPKFGEVLAAVGSIIQTVLLLKFLALFVNERLASSEIIDTVISYYYPEFNEYKITRNLKGVVSIERKGQQVNKDEFMNTYNQLVKIAQRKLTLANLIYEISRISFLLKEKFSLEEIKHSHLIGIPWPHHQQDQDLESLQQEFSEFAMLMHQVKLSDVPQIHNEIQVKPE